MILIYKFVYYIKNLFFRQFMTDTNRPSVADGTAKDKPKFDFKKYREENKEQIKKQMDAYRNNNREKINEKSKVYYEKNKEIINEKRRLKYAKDKLYDN